MIEDYYSEDTANPDDAMNEILEILKEASNILERWLKRFEEEEKQNE
ncbi:MAG: hypothetical protein QW320_04910 [Ignisphaera sp.]